jgi:hypothetical protein
MRIISACCVLGLMVLPFITSCSSMRSGNAVKATYEVDENDGWMTRKIPGLKTLSKLVPPPTEARIKWDQRQKRQGNLMGSDIGIP